MQRWEQQLDKQSLESVYQKLDLDVVNQQRAIVVDPLVTSRVSYINNRAPWLAANTQVALAKSYASDAAIDKVAEFGAQELVNNPDQAYTKMYTKPRGYWISDSAIQARTNVGQGKKNQDPSVIDEVYGMFKGIARVGTALSFSAGELLNNAASFDPGLGPLSKVVNPFFGLASDYKDKNQNLKTALNSLSIFQLLNDWDDQGSGFFISEDMQSKQADAARQFRGTLGGSAFTIGRGAAASVGLDQGAAWFNAVSGVIDFGIALAIPDPNKYVVKGARGITSASRAAMAVKGGEGFVDAFKSAQGVVPLVTKLDAEAFRKGIESEAGLTKSLTGMSLDVRKWNSFMDNNHVAIKAVKDIAKTENPEDILKKFKGRISIEDAQALAKAKTSEEIKGVLVNQYALGGTTLSTNIYDIQPALLHNPGAYLVERTPLVRSRLLKMMPDRDVIIAGDSGQRAKSVFNLINSIENAGGTPEDVREFSKNAFKNFSSTSSADDQRDAYKSYEDALKIIMKRNGISDEIATEILQRPRRDMQELRTYMVSRMGNETDNGMLKVYSNMLRKHFSPDVYNEMLQNVAETGVEGFQIARPVQLSELFDRVQTLPDVRELRRLTSNPLLMGALTEAVGIKGKPTKALYSKWRKINVVEYLDEERALQVKGEIGSLLSKNRSLEDNMRLKTLNDEMEALTKNVEKRVFTGEANGLISFLDTVQNSIWKPLQLASIGYAIRNSIDAQVRMSMGGGSGLLNHPGEFISLLIGETKSTSKLLKMTKKAGFDTFDKSILGEALTGKGEEFMRSLSADHADLLNFSARKQGLSAADHGGHLARTNNWIRVGKDQGEGNYIQGIVNEIHLAHEDVLQRKYAQSKVFGSSEDVARESLVAEASTGRTFAEINGIYKRGVPFTRYENGQVQNVFGPQTDLSNLDPIAKSDFLWNVHLKPSTVAAVDNLSGGLPEMDFMIAFDRVPMFDKVFTNNIDELVPRSPSEPIKLGSVVKISGDQEGIITRLANDGTATIVPVHNGPASKGFYGHPEAKRFVRNAPVFSGQEGSIGLPQKSRMEMYQIEDRTQRDAWFGDAQNKLDQFTNKVFNEMYGQKWVKTTERSPVFRKFYYDAVGQHIDKLNKGDAQKLYADLLEKSRKAKFGDDVGRYIGSKETAAKLKQIASSKGKGGTLTAQQLDDYARHFGIDSTKNLLYDASSKNNLEDVLRIVAPFVSAWREVLGNYVGMMFEDPTVATRFGRFTKQLSDADPDEDGRGFFYKDPQTGESYFKFPMIFGLPIGLKMTGVDAFFEAPVKQLSQGMSWVPALGPLAQIPASFMLRNTPDTNKIVQVLLPYGKVSPGQTVSSLNPLPPVITKTYDVLASFVTDSQDKMNTTFASTYVDVLRAKHASGDYEINTAEGQKKLMGDAKRDAQIISIFRIFQQFVGPTAPTVGYKVKTTQGVDVYVDQMQKVFEKMQRENYDTAVPRFLKVFGEEMALYVGSKSKAVIPGLEGSREFGEWEFANPDILNEYPEVGAYFAPSGSELNFDVFQRQLKEGKRVKLTDDMLIDTAQKRIGSAKYAVARKMFGANPNEAQRNVLANYRKQLHVEFPGFPQVAEFTVGKLDNQIIMLNELVEDKRLTDNPLTPLLKDYLRVRETSLQSVGGKSFDSKKAQMARGSLYNYGNSLADRSPEFARIWQRLLAQEVEG